MAKNTSCRESAKAFAGLPAGANRIVIAFQPPAIFFRFCQKIHNIPAPNTPSRCTEACRRDPREPGYKFPTSAEQHGEERQPGNDLRARRKDAMVAQVSGKCDANQRVSHDETIGGQRTHPAVDIQSAGTAIRENCDRKNRGSPRGEKSDGWRLVARMRGAKCVVRKAVVRHQKQHARRSRDATQRPGKQADRRADINQVFPAPVRARLRPTRAWEPRSCPDPGRPRENPALPNRQTHEEQTAMTALSITTRGMVFSGLRASAPSVVALSNPTKLNNARTSPRRRPPPVIAVKCTGWDPDERHAAKAPAPPPQESRAERPLRSTASCARKFSRRARRSTRRLR